VVVGLCGSELSRVLLIGCRMVAAATLVATDLFRFHIAARMYVVLSAARLMSGPLLGNGRCQRGVRLTQIGRTTVSVTVNMCRTGPGRLVPVV
jgi:hypothetical protein